MYFALSFVRLMVGDAGRSGQAGRFRCRSGARDGPGAARSRGRRGVRKAPIFFTTFARLRQKKTRPRNGTRDAPQPRQPLPRRRPAVHVQHEVDDCDVMTDLGRLPHRSTRFPRPRPMEKNNGLTQHASRNSVPALEIGDPGGAPSVPSGPQWHGAIGRRNCVWKNSLKKVPKTLSFCSRFSTKKKGFVFGTIYHGDRPERPDVLATFISPRWPREKIPTSSC